jgi:hypothetical protein
MPRLRLARCQSLSQWTRRQYIVGTGIIGDVEIRKIVIKGAHVLSMEDINDGDFGHIGISVDSSIASDSRFICSICVRARNELHTRQEQSSKAKVSIAKLQETYA